VNGGGICHGPTSSLGKIEKDRKKTGPPNSGRGGRGGLEQEPKKKFEALRKDLLVIKTRNTIKRQENRKTVEKKGMGAISRGR